MAKDKTKSMSVDQIVGSNAYDGLEKQVTAEYNRASKHQKPKKDEQELRLKLYNNQKRDPEAVGDTTMFTIHQTVLASLYDDRLMVDFVGREEGDDEVAQNLNAMAEFDFDDMEMNIINYNWIWDTLFFGRGLLGLEEYERDPDKGIYLPLPEVIDPIPFLRDTRAVSVNGNRKGKGAAKYLGSEILMTEQDIEELPDLLKDELRMTEISHESGTKSLYQDGVEARNTAQIRQTQRLEGEAELGVNAGYVITRWYTHFKINDEVKKVKVWLANERSKIIAVKVLDNQDKWPIIDRPMYPTSHDWDGTSVPDLTEDKQRARAVAQNLGLQAMTADLYPNYIYDSNKITNRNDLKVGFNKFIPVDSKGENLNTAIMPLIKSRPNMQLLDFIYNSIDISAQKATATPELQQGQIGEQQRTLGEINIVASKVDTRYSLSAKVFGWSEKAFWQQWYQMYKDNFAENIDKKILRIEGAFGAKWRPLSKKDIIARIDPDIKIESKIVNRALQLEERQSLGEYFSLALQEPTSNRRWGLKKLAKLNGLEKDEIDRLFPPTIDEMIAGDENELLNENKITDVLPDDDHNIHLEIHSKAKDTRAAYVHIETHKQALTMKVTMPELFTPDQGVADFQPPGTQNLLPQPELTQSQPISPNQTSGQVA